MERSRILYVLECLQHDTDNDRAVTLKEIQTYLEKETNLGSVSGVSIRRDIQALITAGHHIEVQQGAHNTYYYRLLHPGFTFNEIRFLVDSVSINQFLSAEQKQRLFRKFEGICSRKEVRKLISRIKVSETVPPALDLLDNLEMIYQIIEEKRKINFSYGKYNWERKFVYTWKDRDLTPCAVVYREGRFYLKCLNGADGKIRTYRVDRMRDIIQGEPVQKLPKLLKSMGTVVDIYEPEYYADVTLRIRSQLLDDMLERLGKQVYLRQDFLDKEHLILRAKIGISYGFYRWILKYGDGVEVLAPSEIRQKVADMVQRMAQMYSLPSSND